eukprot:7445475-Pyramimonas_sp.AAC.1
MDCERRRRADVVDIIGWVVAGIWRFRQRTDARWLTLGPLCQALVAGVLVRLDYLVERGIAAANSVWHLEGHRGFAPKLRRGTGPRTSEVISPQQKNNDPSA